MPKAFRRQKPPPKEAFRSEKGDKIVTEIVYSERSYSLHPTKGWRSRRLPEER